MPTFACPKCDDVFDTQRGLDVHHTRTHGERLANRACSHCGEEFYCSYQKKYCSERCRILGVSYAGENNPNYQGKKAKSCCELCGARFEYYPSEKVGRYVGRYCSDCIETEQWRSIPKLEGPNHHRWNGGKQQFSCTICDESVTRYPSEVTGDVVVCSEECRHEWLSNSFTGDGHPNWKGGGNEAYGTGWNAIRRNALERDGYSCGICGKPKAEIGRNPDVHHIIPVRAFIESDRHEKTDVHTLDNVISLCVACHRKADFGKLSRRRLRFLIGAQPPSRS